MQIHALLYDRQKSGGSYITWLSQTSLALAPASPLVFVRRGLLVLGHILDLGGQLCERVPQLEALSLRGGPTKSK